jgi:hypothetical protein
LRVVALLYYFFNHGIRLTALLTQPPAFF